MVQKVGVKSSRQTGEKGTNHESDQSLENDVDSRGLGRDFIFARGPKHRSKPGDFVEVGHKIAATAAISAIQ